MNIIELLKVNIEKEWFFYNHNSSQNDRDNMEKVVGDFLNCDKEHHRETLANIITNYALQPHAKGAEIAPLVDVMNMFEIYGIYGFKNNRKHMIHQVYTFLLGLLLYENVTKIKNEIDNEMRSTTRRYSSGDVKGEFLFRWRLASLSHDIGNGVSLFANDNTKIDNYIFYLQLLSNESWGWNYDGINKLLFLDSGNESLELLDRIDRSNHFSTFYYFLKENPLKTIYYDHGIMSAIILLKILDVMYSKYNEQTIQFKGHSVTFKRSFFEKSIAQAAYAVAIHNLDFYPKILIDIWGTKRIYNFSLRPLSWLLKICDTLQEWNKPKAKKETDYITPDEIELELLNDSVIIKKFPEKDKLKKKLDEFYVGTDIINIK